MRLHIKIIDLTLLAMIMVGCSGATIFSPTPNVVKDPNAIATIEAEFFPTPNWPTPSKWVAELEGTLIFDSSITDLRMMAANRSNSEVLLTGPDRVYFPICSPDGRWISYTQEINGQRRLKLLSRDGTIKRELTTLPGELGEASWSPDSQSIAFISENSGQLDLQVGSISEQKVRSFADISTIEHTPSWSPDSQKIIFSAMQNDRSRLLVLDLTTGVANPVGDFSYNASLPLWSPIGDQIALLTEEKHGYRLQTMSSEGKDVRQLTDDSYNVFYASWSPDARQIVFLAQTTQGESIFVLNTHDKSIQAMPFQASDKLGIPVWSPDGKYLLATYDFNIWVVALMSQKMEQLTFLEAIISQPCWTK